MHVLVVVFFIAAGLQFIYFIVFLAAFGKKRKLAENPPLPVSVIVCAHDEEVNLRELIPELLAQDHPEFEVIIVDDRSNDATFDFLLEETKKDHRLRMVHVNRTPEHTNSKKYSITLGIKAAKYEWILLTDADCRPQSKQWIHTMSKQFAADKTFVIGYSPYQKQGGLLNAFIRFETLLTAIQYFSFALWGKPYMGVGRNLAYRRSFFLEKKGFNTFLSITGGDDDLFVNQHARTANAAVCLEKESHMLSFPKQTWNAFFKQKIRHLSVGKYYRFNHRLLLGLLSLSWLVTWWLGIPLVFFTEDYWIIGILLTRTLFLTLVVQVATNRLGQRFEVWLVPVLDFIYAFYYLVTGLVALRSKKVQWKN